MLLSIPLIIFLALLTLHSGEPSQKSERSAVHICAHVHNKPLRTCSPTHLIAADSSRCRRQYSPSSVLCCYCISATRFFSPSSRLDYFNSAPSLVFPLLRLPLSKLLVPLFPLSCPSLSAAIWRRHCLLSRAEAGKIISLTLDSDSLCKL